MFEFDPNNFQLGDLDRVLKQSQAALGELAKAQEELGRQTGTGDGGDGLVTATVDGSGRLTDITFNPRIMRTDSQTIADYVLEAVQAAQDDQAARSAELLASATGSPPGREQVAEYFEQIQQAFTERLNRRGDSY